MKKKLLTLLLCFSAAVSAQETHIPFNGIVTDVLGTPLKKVKIYNHDERRYTFSNKEGKFGLTDVLPFDTLHLIFNHKAYLIPVDGKKSVHIKLDDQIVVSASEDEALIGLGYGFVKRREQTIPVSGISGEELQRTGKTDILEALVGKVAGYALINGEPRIRSNNSLLLSSEPIYIVDGIRVFSLNYLTVYDVDHVEVLKDASIYGVRGTNGAIVVYTKK